MWCDRPVSVSQVDQTTRVRNLHPPTHTEKMSPYPYTPCLLLRFKLIISLVFYTVLLRLKKQKTKKTAFIFISRFLRVLAKYVGRAVFLSGGFNWVPVYGKLDEDVKILTFGNTFIWFNLFS